MNNNIITNSNTVINPELIIIENYGPILVFFISIFILFKKESYLFYYIIGTIINSIINLFLKYLIKQPRPSVKHIELASNLGYIYSIEKYGMPSGHAQNLGFSIGFMFIFIKTSFILWLFIIISLITLYQRNINQKHSIIQLIIGFIIGLIIGILFYGLTNHYLKGDLSKKKDDNAFFS